MRIYEGDYAYEVERVLNPETQLTRCWRYNVYRVRPGNELLRSGEAASLEAAESSGRAAMEEVIRKQSGPRKSSAA